MEDLTFAYLDGGNVVMLSRPGTAAGPPCSAKEVFRWLFCGISADPSDAEDGDHAKSQNRPKDLWYQSDYLTEPNQHKEEAPLLVGPAKLAPIMAMSPQKEKQIGVGESSPTSVFAPSSTLPPRKNLPKAYDNLPSSPTSMGIGFDMHHRAYW